jgi:hypothetical protein
MDPHHIQPDPNNFIDVWLARQAPLPAYTTFQHLPLSEIDGSRELVFRPLAETIFIHHNDPKEYLKNLTTLGYPDAAEEIDRRPRDPEIRKGSFGEIVASEYLRQSEGYQIPVYRLRKTSDDSTMAGEDILAFKFGTADGTGRELLVGEAKVRGQYASRAVREAYQQICGFGCHPRPKSFLFIIHILREQGRDDEANKILMFLHKFAPHQPVRRHMIFLITGNRPRNPFRCIQDRQKVIDNLVAANVHITELDDFINDLFDCEVEADGA